MLIIVKLRPFLLVIWIECKAFDTLTLKQLSRRHEVLGDEINLIAEHETVIDKGN